MALFGITQQKAQQCPGQTHPSAAALSWQQCRCSHSLFHSSTAPQHECVLGTWLSTPSTWAIAGVELPWVLST